MATGLVTHNDYLLHDTGPLHPEQARRLRAIALAVGRHETLRALELLPPRAATEAEVGRVHGELYIDQVRQTAAQGGGDIDVDTPICAQSYRVALLSAGGLLAGLEAVLDGKLTNAFVASRPPGHHARPNRGMGFCLFNNIAIAARQALELGLERVFILDWDVHHGNGTQEAFYAEKRVFFCSLHQSPWYPFSGDASETGMDGAEGTTLNLPLRAGRRTPEYLSIIDDVVLPAMRQYAPELILVSAGQDIHERDPLGEMRITSEGFRLMTERVVAAAEELCDGRVVMALEGGYDLQALGEGVAQILHGLLGLVPPADGG